MSKAENTNSFTNEIQSDRKDVIGEGNSIVYPKTKKIPSIGLRDKF
jgi:hypothetical protein